MSPTTTPRAGTVPVDESTAKGARRIWAARRRRSPPVSTPIATGSARAAGSYNVEYRAIMGQHNSNSVVAIGYPLEVTRYY